jgi:hypothetical protein
MRATIVATLAQAAAPRRRCRTPRRAPASLTVVFEPSAARLRIVDYLGIIVDNLGM